MILIQDAGHAHEKVHLAELKANGGIVEIKADGSLSARADATREAMLAEGQTSKPYSESRNIPTMRPVCRVHRGHNVKVGWYPEHFPRVG